MIPIVYTIGVYGSTRAAFFSTLESAGIDVLIDIRRRRAVRGSTYAYANAERFMGELAERGIAYSHVLGLAPQPETLALQGKVDSELKHRKSERTELSPAYVERYVAETLDTFDFDAIARQLRDYRAPALFCIERIPQACHRRLVAPKLAQAVGADEVVHLTPDGAGFEMLHAIKKRERARERLRKKY